jgi:hypothetical protein
METTKVDFVLSDMYDLTPGQYMLYLEISDWVASFAILSNVIYLSVAEPSPSVEPVGSPEGSFSLEIDTSRDIVKDASRLYLVIYATAAAHDVDLDNSLTLYSIDVRDSQGVVPPLKKDGRLLQSLAGNKGGNRVHLKPGEKVGFGTLQLPDLYDLTQPGEYTVQLARTDEETKTVVKSNAIALTVKP